MGNKQMKLFFLKYYIIGGVFFFIFRDRTFGSMGGIVLECLKWLVFPFGILLIRHLFYSLLKKLNMRIPNIGVKKFIVTMEGYWKISEGYFYGRRTKVKWFALFVYCILMLQVCLFCYALPLIGIIGLLFFAFQKNIFKKFLKT